MSNTNQFQASNRIPLSQPELLSQDKRAVSEVLSGTQLALGPQLHAFEKQLAGYVGRQQAVAVNSGTSALHLIIRALGIGSGDEVITTPFSFVASANCILMEGATPVFVDIEPRTLCIAPEKIEAAITPKTKAILAVDVFGHPADWNRLEEVAEEHGLLLIEDSAESLGSQLNGKLCGSFGRAAIFGFYPNKQITTGEGGAVVTDDENLARLCRSMARIGSHCIVNTLASIDHDCIIEDYVHLSPGVHLAGDCRIGSHAHIGIGASVLPGCSIGPKSVIGGGAAVTCDIPGDSVAVGIPAKVVK